MDTANVYTNDARLLAKLKELAGKYPKQFKLELRGPHHAVTYTVPKRGITIRAPYNEERRQQQIQEAAENGSPFKEENSYAEN